MANSASGSILPNFSGINHFLPGDGNTKYYKTYFTTPTNASLYQLTIPTATNAPIIIISPQSTTSGEPSYVSQINANSIIITSTTGSNWLSAVLYKVTIIYI